MKNQYVSKPVLTSVTLEQHTTRIRKNSLMAVVVVTTLLLVLGIYYYVEAMPKGIIKTMCEALGGGSFVDKGTYVCCDRPRTSEGFSNDIMCDRTGCGIGDCDGGDMVIPGEIVISRSVPEEELNQEEKLQLDMQILKRYVNILDMKTRSGKRPPPK
jgi:hypothetical protein